MKSCLIFLLPYILLQSMLMQDIQGQQARKNALYGEAETLILFGTATINYDRTFLPDKYIHLGAGGGFGRGYLLEFGHAEYEKSFSIDGGFAYRVEGSIFLDFGLELCLGYTFIRGGGSDIFDWPIVSIGYRTFDKPEFWRLYIGSWGIGLSVGYSF